MPRLAANLSLLFTELPFPERFAAAAAAGFSAVEMHYPYEFAASVLRDLLDRHGLRLVLFNSPRGNASAGEHGLACRAEERVRFADSIDTAVRYATALDCPVVHVLTGLVSPRWTGRRLSVCGRPAGGGRRYPCSTGVDGNGRGIERRRHARLPARHAVARRGPDS